MSNREFSFVMLNYDEVDQSHVDFGPIKPDHMLNGSDEGMYYFPMNEDYFWSVEC